MLRSYIVIAGVGALTGFVMGVFATRDRMRHAQYIGWGAVVTSVIASLPMLLLGASGPISNLRQLLVIACFSAGLVVLFSSPRRRR